MRRLPVLSVLFCVLAWGENWPQWRGPSGTGVSGRKSCLRNGAATRTSPGGRSWRDWASPPPVVWGDRVFVTYQVGAGASRQGVHPTFVQDGNPVAAGETPLGGARPGKLDEKILFAVAAFGATDGRPLWEHKIPAAGKLPDVHEKRNLATSSAVTDGERVYAWFSTGQLAAVDMNGKPVWTATSARKSPFDLDWGHASSPALSGDRLILVSYQGRGFSAGAR